LNEGMRKWLIAKRVGGGRGEKNGEGFPRLDRREESASGRPGTRRGSWILGIRMCQGS